MLNKHNLNIAQLCSKEESRFTLQGILVSPEGTVVTDGHVLMKVTLPDMPEDSAPVIDGCTPTAEFKPFILPKAAALDIAKQIPKSSTIPVIQNVFVGSETDAETVDPKSDEPKPVVLGVTDLETPKVFRPKRLTGNFPDYTRVIPKDETAEFAIGMDMKLLSRLVKQLDSFIDNKSISAATLYFKDEDSAMWIKARNAETGQEAVAIGMPFRDEGAAKKAMNRIRASRKKEVADAVNEALKNRKPTNGEDQIEFYTNRILTALGIKDQIVGGVPALVERIHEFEAQMAKEQAQCQ